MSGAYRSASIPATHARRGGRTACGHIITRRMIAYDAPNPQIDCMNCIGTRYMKENDGNDGTFTTQRMANGTTIEFEYKNHAGKVATRRVVILDYRFGKTPYHNDREQWFLHGHDVDKVAERTFAIADMSAVRVIGK